MADIVVKCAACGTESSISEYVDPDLATCRSCGQKLKVPHLEISGPRPAPRQEKATVPPPIERSTMTAFRASSDLRTRSRRRRRWLFSWTPSPLTIWLVFAVVTAVMCLLRFVLLKESDRDLLIDAGLICLLVLHFTVVVDAFSDNIMTGMLCLFIPFYSLFYLYSQCDSYILRLSVGVLLVPFGWDGVMRSYAIVVQLLEMLRNAAMFDS